MPMSDRLTLPLFEDESISSAAVHPASPPRSRGRAKATPMLDGSGLISFASSVNVPPDGSWQRTLLESLRSNLMDLTGSSVSWRRRDTKCSRSLWALTTLAPRTDGSASSSWPTPKDVDGRPKGNGGMNRNSPGLDALARSGAMEWPTPTRADGERASETFMRGNPTLLGATRDWPTPTATAYGTNQGGSAGRVGPIRPSLETLVKWPTPTAMDANSSGAAGYSTESGRHSGTTLTDAAREWATPTAHDSHPGNAARVGRFGKMAGGRNLTDEVYDGPPVQASHSTSGSRRVLSPDWVEALQGFPLGWTRGSGARDCVRLAIRSSQKSLIKSGEP